jgi:hypothetical protein
MYYAVVGLFMFLLPCSSLVMEVLLTPQPVIPLIGKWYVFWAVGVRLFLAGLRQVIQPRYTAQTILGLKSDESLVVVRELGFANLAFGLSGLLSIHFSSWCIPIALAGGIFYGLAGGNHALRSHRGKLENIAMVSDIFAAVVLLSFCISMLAS